jgi:vancomycin resistance protein YoaR
MTSYPGGEYYVPAARHEPSFNPWLVRLPILLICGALLLVGSLVALVVAVQVQVADKIVPGMSAYGVNLSGLTRAEAVQALSDAFTYDKNAVFTFRYGDRFWQMSAGELGITFDVDATVDAAYSAGHSGSLVNDLVAQASIWLNGRSVAPIVRYDQNITIARLNTIAAELNRPPVDATLTLGEALPMTAPQIVVTPPQVGLALDIATTLRQLEEALLQLNTGAEIPLIVNEAQPRITDASAAAAKIATALSGPLTLATDDQRGGTLGPWTATVDQIRAVLNLTLVDNGDGTQRYDVQANVEAFRPFVASLAPGLISLPVDGRFHFNEELRTLEPIVSSVSGRALDVDATLTRLGEAIFSTSSRIVPLAYSYTLPRYNDNMTASELGITQLVAEATSHYTGSTQSRIANIIEAAQRFDGLIIAPGEEFSFNTYLGDISVEEGFVQGKIIFGGRTVEGVGGGVCQVSTTIFRAALKGGFPITERNSHGYRVGFYELNGSPPGLDAAIFQPTADFRFVNDTEYHLLLETSIFPQEQAVQFRLYSTNPGRQVVIEGPTIRDTVPALSTIYELNPELQPGQEMYVDWAKDGADVTFTRRILDSAGGEIRTDTIYTHYLPWAAVVQVAAGDPRLG